MKKLPQNYNYQNNEIMEHHFNKCDDIFKEPISKEDQTLKIRKEVHEMVGKLFGRLIANVN